MSRLWLAPLVAFFCLPLFLGLGDADLQNDEAIYSFAVDRILETGDWLTPKSSPREDVPFLEKPPLKFWIVAAPIRLGLLPHSEFGLRFWDALFGGVAFVYVFTIGSRLAGPMCGFAAVFLLFVQVPLLFEQGVRGNTMEAPLLLCYCGGVFHYVRCMASDDMPQRWWHALAVGLYFVLGFMTKFVAALFLPLVLVAAGLLVSQYRRRLLRDWRIWVGVAAVVGALTAPWFVYARYRFGTLFWETIFSVHVQMRFSTHLDPRHLQPWHFYFSDMYRRLTDPVSGVLVGAGMVLLLAQTIRRRWAEALVVLLWFWLPVTIISAGTSKLYHYLYPFLPPLALAGGYLLALVSSTVHAHIDSALQALDRRAVQHVPRVAEWIGRPVVRVVLLSIAGAAVAIAVVTLVYGPIRIAVGQTLLLRNSGVIRPCVLAVACALLARTRGSTIRVVVPLLIAILLPLPAYRDQVARLRSGEHPMRSTRDCLRGVEAKVAGSTAFRMYVDVPDDITQSLYYYFGPIRSWTSAPARADRVSQYLHDPTEQRPILISDSRYRAFMDALDSRAVRARDRVASPAMVRFGDALLLLPGPYSACSADARAAARRVEN